MKLVLLYDTGEADFARDVLALLQALGLSVSTVIGAANRGETLSQKERRVLAEAEGLIFLLTPGSERNGIAGYASQSVCDEMGRAEERFKSDLSKVVYLADSEWKAHAISQKAYIRFVRTDHRSMIQAFRELIMELREMGALASEAKAEPQVTIEEVADQVSADVKEACKFIADQDKAMVSYDRLDWFLRTKLSKNQTQINLLLRELLDGWIRRLGSGLYYSLTDWGFSLVKHELENPPQARSISDLARRRATYGRPTNMPDE